MRNIALRCFMLSGLYFFVVLVEGMLSVWKTITSNYRVTKNWIETEKVSGTIVYELFLQLPLILRRRAQALLCHHLLLPHRTAKWFLIPYSSLLGYLRFNLIFPPISSLLGLSDSSFMV
jgi:hypothetical protein